MKRFLSLLLLLSAAGCGSPHERLADAVTRAVIADDLSPVLNDFDSRIEGELTRVRVAQFSDELLAQGPYQGLHRTTAPWCPQDALCFDVRFEKARRPFHEVMRLSKDGKVRYWWIRPSSL